jgi:hypothetical protein
VEGKEVLDEVQAKGQGGKPGTKPNAPPVKKPAPAPVTAKPGQKPGKGGKGQVEEEVKEKTQMEKDMETALECEKQSTAFRVMLIYKFALNSLVEMRSRCSDVYERLNVFTELAFKIENDCMDELVR